MTTYTSEEREKLIHKNIGNSIADTPLFFEWNWIRNGEFCVPEMFSPCSKTKVWWIGNCGHEWAARIYSRTYRTNKKRDKKIR